MDQHSFNQSLHRLVDRQIILTDVFRFSMQKEFWPSPLSTKDWAENLEWLIASVEPILFLGQHNPYKKFVEPLEKALSGSRKFDELCTTYSSKLQSAMELFSNAELEQTSPEIHVELLLDGTEFVYEAYGSAVKLKKELVDIAPSTPANGVLFEFQNANLERMEKLTDLFNFETKNAKESIKLVADTESDIQRCMASRKLYLIATYFKYMFPAKWEAGTFGAATAQLQDAIRKSMLHGSAFRKSVITRIDENKYYLNQLVG